MFELRLISEGLRAEYRLIVLRGSVLGKISATEGEGGREGQGRHLRCALPEDLEE
jgi:hypothetical protein